MAGVGVAHPSRSLGYVPQGLGLYEDLTVAENLRFAVGAFGARAPERLDGTLEAVRGELVAELPLGPRRRVAFAAALAHHPDLFVLDEPTSGVDPLGRARLWETIRAVAEAGAGVLVAIVGNATAVEVRPERWEAAFTALDRAGMPAALVGRRLRVPDADLQRVAAALGTAGVEAGSTWCRRPRGDVRGAQRQRREGAGARPRRRGVMDAGRTSGRTGRRPGESGTREAILEAARREFAQHGYDRATIRPHVARGACVDPALVHHFFGAKTELFAAAMLLPVNPAELVQALLAGGPELIGERLIGTFLSLWDHAANRDVFIGLLRSAVTDEHAATLLRELAGSCSAGSPPRSAPRTRRGGQPGLLADLRLGRGPLHPADRAARLGPRRAGRGGGRADHPALHHRRPRSWRPAAPLAVPLGTNGLGPGRSSVATRRRG
jgi:AcrR family transcriptional regulator